MLTVLQTHLALARATFVLIARRVTAIPVPRHASRLLVVSTTTSQATLIFLARRVDLASLEPPTFLSVKLVTVQGSIHHQALRTALWQARARSPSRQGRLRSFAPFTHSALVLATIAHPARMDTLQSEVRAVLLPPMVFTSKRPLKMISHVLRELIPRERPLFLAACSVGADL